MYDKKVLVPLADGFEEIEAVTIVDILRRAGATVVTAGLTDYKVTGSHGIALTADSIMAEEAPKEWDMVALPGGIPGAPNLAENDLVLKVVKQTAARKHYTAAVCAAPFVLEKAGVIKNKKVTSHPGTAEKILTGIHQGTRVVIDSKVITGQACGSAMEFAFTLVEALFGPEKVKELNAGVLPFWDTATNPGI